MNTTRASLLQRLRQQPQSADWEEFHAVYQPLLFRFCLSQGVPPNDVADIVQDVFAKLVRVLQSFHYDPQRGRFRTWLYRIARNQIADWRRRRRRRREECCAPDSLAEVSTAVESFHWDREHRTRVLEFALQSVRSESQTLTWLCFARRYLQGRSGPEIALETGLSETGVYTNASRVLKRLRDKCQHFEEELDHDHTLGLPRRRRTAAVRGCP
ncbi:MAG: RNA polymerase sigma factor [Planctomycetaceae bacterium]